MRQRSRENPNLTIFSFIMQDETAEIHVVAWDDVATKQYDLPKVGNCYRITISLLKVKEITVANQACKDNDKGSCMFVFSIPSMFSR